jgi:hypothetical protein
MRAKLLLRNYICYIYSEFMTISRYLEFYDYFGKFRRLPIEGVFGKNENEGANGSLPFFVCRFLSSGYSQCDNSRRLNNE